MDMELGDILAGEARWSREEQDQSRIDHLVGDGVAQVSKHRMPRVGDNARNCFEDESNLRPGHPQDSHPGAAIGRR